MENSIASYNIFEHFRLINVYYEYKYGGSIILVVVASKVKFFSRVPVIDYIPRLILVFSWLHPGTWEQMSSLPPLNLPPRKTSWSLVPYARETSTLQAERPCAAEDDFLLTSASPVTPLGSNNGEMVEEFGIRTRSWHREVD